MNCINCYQEVPDGAKFCPHCGAKQPVPGATHMQAPSQEAASQTQQTVNTEAGMAEEKITEGLQAEETVTNTTTEPYSLVETDDATADNAGLVYAGNDGGRYTLVGQAKNELPDVISDEKKEQINFIGKEVFGQVKFTTDADGNVTIDDANSSGAFKALYELKAALQNDPVDEQAVRATLDSLDASMSQVSAARTKTGALGQEFEDIQDAYANDTLNLKQLRSDLEDTDLPSAVSDWYTAYQSLQASYQMFSQTMNVSLLNYI